MCISGTYRNPHIHLKRKKLLLVQETTCILSVFLPHPPQPPHPPEINEEQVTFILTEKMANEMASSRSPQPPQPPQPAPSPAPAQHPAAASLHSCLARYEYKLIAAALTWVH